MCNIMAGSCPPRKAPGTRRLDIVSEPQRDCSCHLRPAGRIEFCLFQAPGRPTRSGLPRKQFEKRSFAADVSLDAVIQLIRFAAVLVPRRHTHAGWSRDQRVDLKRADVEGEGNRMSSARRLAKTRTVCPQLSKRNKITPVTHRCHM